MKSYHVRKLFEEVDTIKSNLEHTTSLLREQSYLAQFLVVFISGIYEEAIETIITEKVARENSIEINLFIDKYLHESFRNPNVDNIVTLLSKFSPIWKNEIENLPNIQKSALNTIVTHKNNIAHGQSSDITINEILKLDTEARKIIEKIDDMIL